MLKAIRASVVALSLAVAGLSAQPAAAPKDTSTRAKATAQNAAAFVGEWELSGEGTHGPASFTLSIKSKDKALATELKKGETAQTVNEVSLVGSKLELAVVFKSDAGEHPGVITLTPSGEKTLLHIAVDGGLATLDGTAKKKDKK